MRVTGTKRGKTRVSESRLVFVLLLIGRESGAKFFSQSQSVAMQNQSNCKITLDSQMKTTYVQDCIQVLFNKYFIFDSVIRH